MAEKQYTFKQALVIAIAPSLATGLIAAASAYFAIQANSEAIIAKNEAKQAKERAELIDRNQKIRQKRLDERDKIVYEFAINNQLKSALLIPIEDNEAWVKYLECRNQDGSKKRYDCSKEQDNIIGDNTPLDVDDEIISR